VRPTIPANHPLAQRFELLGELGRGGMGVVYRARELHSGRQVALKVVLGGGDETRAQRFAREGQLTAKLQHPGIVSVHTMGELGGVAYLVYELVEGARTLDQVVGELDLRARVALVRDAARALGHAHAQGILHRDVKPQNLLVDAQGQMHVTDFGLAAAQGLERLTRTGALVGTPTHMAPEQVGATAGPLELGPHTDVWALGVVLYQALCDRLPFEGDTLLEIMSAVVSREITAPRQLRPDVPRPLETICLQALQRDVNRRYPHGAALADDLDAYLTGGRISASGPSAISLLRARIRRRALPVALGLLLLAGLGITGLFVQRHLAEQEAARHADALLADVEDVGRRLRSLRGVGVEERCQRAELLLSLHRLVDELPESHREAGERVAEHHPLEDLEQLHQALLSEPDGWTTALVVARALLERNPSLTARARLATTLSVRAAEHGAEACEVWEELAADPQATGGHRELAARALLELHRPGRAAVVLAGVSDPHLLQLRAWAHELAGDLTRAVADLDDAQASQVDTTSVANCRIQLARVLVAQGPASLARASEVLHGSHRRYLAHGGVRGLLELAAGQPAEARRLLEEAGWDHALGGLHLRRGRRAEALGALRRALAAQAPAPEEAAVWGWRADALALDAAVADWLGGADQVAARRALGDLLAGAAEHRVDPRLAAVAGAWLALVEAAEGDVSAAREVLAMSEELASTALGQRVHRLLAGDPAQPVPRDPLAPPPLPVASQDSPDALAEAQVRLLSEAHLLHLAASSRAEEAELRRPGTTLRRERLLRRALALDPSSSPATLLLAELGDPSALAALVRSVPLEAHRLIVRALPSRAPAEEVARATSSARRLLANDPSLPPLERTLCAGLLARAGELEAAWEALQPALEVLPLDWRSVILGTQLAEDTGRPVSSDLVELAQLYRRPRQTLWATRMSAREPSLSPEGRSAIRLVHRFHRTAMYWSRRAMLELMGLDVEFLTAGDRRSWPGLSVAESYVAGGFTEDLPPPILTSGMTVRLGVGRDETQARLLEELQRRPEHPAPLLAMSLVERGVLWRGAQTEDTPDLDLALDRALAALERLTLRHLDHPGDHRSPGEPIRAYLGGPRYHLPPPDQRGDCAATPLAVAAAAAVDAGLPAEATHLLELALCADPQAGYPRWQQVRLALLRGEAALEESLALAEQDACYTPTWGELQGDPILRGLSEEARRRLRELLERRRQ
jgi:tetratricopeptide (TPR) repeat protein